MERVLRHGGRANRRRGEVEAELDGERRILCLTLGALAELETAFAAGDLSGLAQRFSSGRLKAGDMITVIGAGLRGGGNLLSDAEVAAMSVDGGLAGYARIVGDLLEATFGAGDADRGDDRGHGGDAGKGERPSGADRAGSPNLGTVDKANEADEASKANGASKANPPKP